jgi:predicted NBD/HSP70 family sugar kinase
MLSASMWVASMLSESTYSTLHEWGHILVDLDAKCIYVGCLDAK